jgi:hypothetical protein
MNKRPNEKAKPRPATTHPETQRRDAKTGTPGSEASKAPSGAKDVRSAHDKDGNSEQRGR